MTTKQPLRILLKSLRHIANLNSGNLKPFILGALTFALRLPFWSRPFDMDEGLYAYGGWQFLKGLVLYRDLWDFKPPGVYFLNALIFSISSPEAVNIYICAAFFGSLTCLGIYKTAERLWGKGTALLASLFFALFSASPYVQGCGVNTEVFMIAPLTWGLYAIMRALEDGKRRWYVISGLLIGCATLFKQVAGVGVFLVPLAAYFNVKQSRVSVRRALFSLFIFLGSCALPWLLFCGYFACHGALTDFLFWVFRYPSRYMSFAYDQLSWYHWWRIRWVLTGTLMLWVFSLVALPLMLRRTSANSEKVLGIFFLLSVIAITSGWMFFPHYFLQMIPASALLAAKGLTWVYSVMKRRGSKAGVLIFVALLLLLAFLYGKTHYKFYMIYTGDEISFNEYRWGLNAPVFGTARKLGFDLRENTDEGETVFVWKHHPEINFYALRKTPARSPIMSLPNLPDLYPETMRDIVKNRPTYIVLFDVLSTFKFDALNSILKREYVKGYGINGQIYAEQGIYKRRSDE